MTRQDYEDARDAFFNSKEKPIVTSMMAGSSIAGWTISREGITLPSARNSTRVFKTLTAVAALCEESGIESFDVVGI